MTTLSDLLVEGGTAKTLLGGWALPLAILTGSLLLGWIGKLLLLSRLRALVRRTTTRADDAALDAVAAFWLPALVCASLLPALRAAPLAVDQRQFLSQLALSALLLVATLAASRFAGELLAGAATPEREATRRASLLQTAARAAVLTAGLLLVLDNSGVEIKTLLTALGVGSLAVALALQPTLTNLFAGILLSVAKPLRVGDFIELEDGTQGHVEDIGWRATRILQLPNNLLVVPNARLADMRLINYSLPDQPQAIVFPLGVAYDSDLRQVERVVVEVAAEVQRSLPEADPGHQPFVRFNAFSDSSIDCSVILRSRRYTDRWTVVHEFMLRLKERFDQEGISIPFPQRDVHLARALTAATQ